MPYYIKRWPKKAKNESKEAKTKSKVSKPRKPNLVKKLDRVFALYIRLRDVMPNGYVRCISCGNIKAFEDVDCGHYHSRTHMGTRFDEQNCNAECQYCLTPDALILTQDLKWVKLGDIKEGDKLFSFEEDSNIHHPRVYKVGTVTHIHREIQDVYEVELENGDRIKTTANHKWLVRNRGTGMRWMETQDLWCNGKRLNGRGKSGPHWGEVSTTVCKIINVVEQDNSYESGWIAGMLDADGHVCQQNINNPDGTVRYGFRVGIAQSEKYPDICHDVKRLLQKFTGNNKTCRQTMDKPTNGAVRKNCELWQFLITGTNIEKLQFLMRVRPHKIAKVDVEKLGQLKSQYDTKVKSVRYVGKQEIVVMETDTHTFVANGYAMHNCNRFCADHLDKYAINLVKKIGQQRFDMLRVKAKTPKHFMDFELEQMIEHYTREVKRLSTLKGIKVNL